MSSIVINPHPRTLAEIAIQPKVGAGDASCGCHERGEKGRWWLCPYHLGVDEGWSERDDVIKDLNDRIDRGIEEITAIRRGSDETNNRWRLFGKMEGLKLVKDWLRAYENG